MRHPYTRKNLESIQIIQHVRKCSTRRCSAGKCAALDFFCISHHNNSNNGHLKHIKKKNSSCAAGYHSKPPRTCTMWNSAHKSSILALVLLLGVLAASCQAQEDCPIDGCQDDTTSCRAARDECTHVTSATFDNLEGLCQVAMDECDACVDTCDNSNLDPNGLCEAHVDACAQAADRAESMQSIAILHDHCIDAETHHEIDCQNCNTMAQAAQSGWAFGATAAGTMAQQCRCAIYYFNCINDGNDCETCVSECRSAWTTASSYGFSDNGSLSRSTQCADVC